MNKVQLFQDRILTDAKRLALATGAATYRWEGPSKAPVNASLLLNARRYGDDAKDLWTTLNTVQETSFVAANATTRAPTSIVGACPRAGQSKSLMRI
jgi:hypothetical protein